MIQLNFVFLSLGKWVTQERFPFTQFCLCRLFRTERYDRTMFYENYGKRNHLSVNRSCQGNMWHYERTGTHETDSRRNLLYQECWALFSVRIIGTEGVMYICLCTFRYIPSARTLNVSSDAAEMMMAGERRVEKRITPHKSWETWYMVG